jgi:uncharacterized protein YegP (UPF0339 family)
MRRYKSLWTAVLTALVLLAGAARAQERKMTFEVYQDAKDEYRWRLKAANGKVLATPGDGYKRKADCLHGIEVIQKEAGKEKTKLKFETYQDKKMEYRWRLKAANGNILAVSSEGYKSKEDCQRGVELLKEASKAEVKDLTKK